jgi:hypothetical protein
MKLLHKREGEDLAGVDTDGAAVAAALSDWRRPRTEKRQPVVRIVEYSRYPRTTRGDQRLVAFTRDESKSGLCITTKHSERKGTLLRVSVRNVDGRSSLEALAEVVWCGARGDGSFWIGLSLLELTEPAAVGSRRMLTVRRPPDEDEVSLTA